MYDFFSKSPLTSYKATVYFYTRTRTAHTQSYIMIFLQKCFVNLFQVWKYILRKKKCVDRIVAIWKGRSSIHTGVETLAVSEALVTFSPISLSFPDSIILSCHFTVSVFIVISVSQLHVIIEVCARVCKTQSHTERPGDAMNFATLFNYILNFNVLLCFLCALSSTNVYMIHMYMYVCVYIC